MIKTQYHISFIYIKMGSQVYMVRDCEWLVANLTSFQTLFLASLPSHTTSA